MSTNDRTPPKRIRVTRLQETHLEALAALEQACTAMYHESGFDTAEVPARSVQDLARLPRDHNVFVAEADHEVAGYMAWRDESPGVAYLEEISVHPQYQRFGVGSRLLQALEEDALRVGLSDILGKTWEKAAWAQKFYAHHGFSRVDETASARVLGWQEERSGGRPITLPGAVLIWKPLRAPAVVAEESTADGDE
jgi:amino-acid N-acetyltransferase